MKGFRGKLEARSREAGSLVCVGLDPDFRRHRPEQVAAYNRGVIEASAPYAACFKPNIAFYEQFGVAGLKALEETLEAVPAGIPVIGDIKRGDVGNTAEAYARAAFEAWGFDAVTVSAFLGRDSVDPFLAYEGCGVFVLCRTSNPGASRFQEIRLAGGSLLYEEVAREVLSWDNEQVGLVVGATAAAELARVRALAPATPLLIPGVGAQGGTAAEVIAAAGATPGLTLVNASRSIYYAGAEGDFERCGAAARALRDELNAAAV
jgi:orotidine-5'-phosphate decarboxylase